jgi:hypothetical protein
MARISADPHALVGEQPAVSAVGDTISAILARLSTVLDSAGACWGDDDAGAVFARQYLPAGAAVRDVLVRTAASIRLTAQEVGTVAGILSVAERDAGAAWESDPS